MAIPTPKFAVYYGTHRLDNGEYETLTALQVATLYGVQADPYLAVPLAGPSPFHGGQQELSYIHLKPQPDGDYYDAHERYNTDMQPYLDEDFEGKAGGKWARPPQQSEEDQDYL